MKSFVTAILILTVVSVNANAALIFTVRDEWEAALTGQATIQTETFSIETANAARFTLESDVSSRTGPGAPFADFTEHQVEDGRLRVKFRNDLGASAARINFITWTFPEEVFAFGVDLANVISGNNGLKFEADFNGNSTERVLVSDYYGQGSGYRFLGMIGSSPFNEVNVGLTGSRNTVRFDNLSFASVVQVSEPSTLPLIALVFGLMLWGKQRVSRKITM